MAAPEILELTADDDQACIERCLAGDPEAFRPLVERYAPLIHRLVGRLAPAADREELAQQTFIAAYERLAQYAGKARFSTWLCQIAVNKVRDWARAARRSPAGIDIDEVDIPDQDGEGRDRGPESLALAGERAAALARVLARLSAADRELVVLRYVLEEDYATVARVLGISVGAAKVRGLRVRQLLRKRLAEEGL